MSVYSGVSCCFPFVFHVNGFFYLLALAVADSMAIVFDGLVDGIDCMKTSKLFAFNNELCVFGWLPSSFLYNKLI